MSPLTIAVGAEGTSRVTTKVAFDEQPMVDRRPRMLTLSTNESLILELLVQKQGMYGLQQVTASGGLLKRGAVYVTLGRMEEKGYPQRQAV